MVNHWYPISSVSIRVFHLDSLSKTCLTGFFSGRKCCIQIVQQNIFTSNKFYLPKMISAGTKKQYCNCPEIRSNIRGIPSLADTNFHCFYFVISSKLIASCEICRCVIIPKEENHWLDHYLPCRPVWQQNRNQIISWKNEQETVTKNERITILEKSCRPKPWELTTIWSVVGAYWHLLHTCNLLLYCTY